MPSTSMEVYCGVSGRGCDDGTGGAPKTGVAMSGQVSTENHTASGAGGRKRGLPGRAAPWCAWGVRTVSGG